MAQEHFISKWKMVVADYPEQIALEEGNNTLTYQQLHERVKGLAAVLTAQDFPPNSPILIDIEKSADFIIAMLAVWWAGHYYIPISAALPEERRQFIAKATQAAAVLRMDKQRSLNVPVILATERSAAVFEPILDRSQRAYIYFTSGSTGTAKGVVVTHKGLCNVLEQQVAFFELDSNTKSLFFLSTLFDASLSDIGTALLSGGCLVIPKESDLNSPQKISNYLLEKEISYVDIPPVVLGLLDSASSFPKLKTIVVGGEAIAAQTIHQWQDKVRLIVVYGPTEATICTSMLCCKEVDWTQSFIGQPIGGVEYWLDANEELFIAGDALAAGYLNQQELTAAKFVERNGKRYYKTGDRVERDTEGNYIFKGRIDRQFKISGKLVAPEEIEAVIKGVEEVQNAVVTKEGTKLVAWIASTKEEDLLAKIKTRISERLPAWMQPSKFIVNQEIETTVTGKTNVKLTIKDAVFLRLKTYWEEVLEMEDFSIYEAFETLGGTSFDRMLILGKASANNIFICADQFSPQTCLYDLWESVDKEVNSIPYLKGLLEELSPQIINQQTIKREVIQTNEAHYLLTGATGFLGRRVLVELLQNTTLPIYCLVRCKTEEEGAKRLQTMLHSIDSNIKIKDRVKVLKGDLSQEQWGLTLETQKELATRVTKVFHCAAWISNMGSLEEMLTVNVKSLAYLFELLQLGPKKELHYASTLSVFVASDLKGGRCLEQEMIPKQTKIYGAYAQSKWLAEQLVFQAQRELDLDVFSYRLGLLTGDTNQGIGAENDLLGMFIRAVRRLKVLPQNKGHYAIDVTPVDFAAAALVRIAHSNQKEPQIYHIANPASLTLQDFVYILNEEGFGIEWREEAVFHTLAKAKGESLLLTLMQHENKQLGLDLFQATGFQFDVQNTRAVLAGNYDCPKADSDLLKKYLDYYINER